MTTTVREVLFASPDEKSRLADALAEAGAVSTAALKVLPMDQIIDAVWDLLDLPLASVARAAWDRHERIQQAKSATSAKPGTLEKVRLATHTIRSAHHPKLEFDVAGASLPALSFDLDVSLRLEAAIITVTEGAIRDIAPAAAAAEATLAAGGKTLVKRQLASVTL
jgi:hypothetical protein